MMRGEEAIELLKNDDIILSQNQRAKIINLIEVLRVNLEECVTLRNILEEDLLSEKKERRILERAYDNLELELEKLKKELSK